MALARAAVIGWADWVCGVTGATEQTQLAGSKLGIIGVLHL